MYKKQLEEYFAAHQQEMIDDICALMRIPSDRQEPKEGMPFGEGPAKALEKAMEIGQRMGMKVTDYDHYVATFDINDGPRGLDILAHLDIVPVGDDWTVTKPFEPKIVDGKLYTNRYGRIWGEVNAYDHGCGSLDSFYYGVLPVLSSTAEVLPSTRCSPPL